MNKKEKLIEKLEILSQISKKLDKEEKLKTLKKLQNNDKIVNTKLHK